MIRVSHCKLDYMELVNDPAVDIQNVLCKIGNKIILNDISLSLKKGEITGILGPNGAGKTTLLSLINGLRKHNAGTISVLGEKLPVKGGKLRRRIGVVFQETALYEELSTFENLHFSASLYNVQNPEGRISEVLDLLDLSDRSDQMVRELSGGLRRRVAIARALLHDPELLIIDEPTLGVDVQARHTIWLHLRHLKSKGNTIIVATNYLDEAQALCSKVAVLKAGRVIALETPDSLIARSGYCLDIECSTEDGEKIKVSLTNADGVLHADPVPTGISVFLNSDSAQENIISLILKNAHIDSLRVRAPDLAEIFKILDQQNGNEH